MRRIVYSFDKHPTAPLRNDLPRPSELYYDLNPAANRCALVPLVSAGQAVCSGEVLASCEVLKLHAALAGEVVESDRAHLLVKTDADTTESSFVPPTLPDLDQLPGFMAEAGFAGMGGSCFPTSIKMKAALQVHTLLINTVECEPGIQIDEALLQYDSGPVLAGLNALKQLLPLKRQVLACKKKSISELTRLGAIPEGCEVLGMANTYPAGAEKLIVKAHTGRWLPTGVLPMQWGLLVMSVASIWALGRYVLEGRPSIDRPLTLIGPDGKSFNTVAPVGARIGEWLTLNGLSWDPGQHVLLAGGLMMGRQVSPADPISKGTNAIFIRSRAPRLEADERPCMGCGSCFDACPLSLHPIGMATRLRDGDSSSALKAQLAECFLCGACSAVCPVDIPLADIFREGKPWLRKQEP